MENASRALLIAGGILLGILILALMITLFESSRSLTESYDNTKQEEKIQQFNANFTKYIGQILDVHKAVTISNFAKENGVAVDPDNINSDSIKNNYDSSYTIEITTYSTDGYITSIKLKSNNGN